MAFGIQGRQQTIGTPGVSETPKPTPEVKPELMDYLAVGVGTAKTADDVITRVKSSRIQDLKNRNLFGDTLHPDLMVDAGSGKATSIFSTTPSKGYFGDMSKQGVGDVNSLLQLNDSYILSENASYDDLSTRLDKVGTLTPTEKSAILDQYHWKTEGPKLTETLGDELHNLQQEFRDGPLEMENNLFDDTILRGPESAGIPDAQAIGDVNTHIYKSLQDKGIITEGMDFNESMELVKQHRPHMFPPNQFTEMVDNQPILMPKQNIGSPMPYDLDKGMRDIVRDSGPAFHADYSMSGEPVYESSIGSLVDKIDPAAYAEYRKNNPVIAGSSGFNRPAYAPPKERFGSKFGTGEGLISQIGKGGDKWGGKFGTGTGKISQFGSKFGTGEGAIASGVKGKVADIRNTVQGVKQGFQHLGNIGQGGIKAIGKQIGSKIASKLGIKAATTAATSAATGAATTAATTAATSAAASAGASAASTGALAAMGPAGWAMMALSLFGGKLFKKHTFLGQLFSDERLKKNIKYVGKSNSGIPIVDFEYRDEMNIPGRYRGVLSKDVPQAKEVHPAYGFDVVDYSKIDVEFKRIN